MSYYPKGHRFNPNEDEDVDDFDEHDPTPYGGGYDIALTYGRPLPPSDETCYRPSASASGRGGGSGYGKRNDDEPTSGYGRRPEHGSGGYGSEYGSGHPRRNETEGNEEGYAGGGRKTYGHSDHTYGRNDDGSNRRPTHGHRNDDDDRRPRYGRNNDNDDDDDDNDGYRGRKNYGDDDDEDNDRPRRNRY
ncbi:hypothetical protein E3N88_20048 [Mikania micrantha]|uniref:Uncharacterized protein n=1 Tax=Mikania micrantha TaxID=192012 RepID=A0A5N6NII2_9ASTR|nr:hypothetical protein E3N88_20048 [Mikania micrantha]